MSPDEPLSTAQIIAKTLDIIVCPTCLDIFIEPISLKCGHTQCKKCINAWMTKSNTCPECRSEIRLDELQSKNLILECLAQLFKPSSLLKAKEIDAEIVVAATKKSLPVGLVSTLSATSASFYPASVTAASDSSASSSSASLSTSVGGTGAPSSSPQAVQPSPVSRVVAPSAAEIREIFEIVKAILIENDNEATAIASLDWHVPNNLRHNKPLLDILREHPEIEVCTCEHSHITLANFEGDNEEEVEDEDNEDNDEVDDSDWDDDETHDEEQIRRFVDIVLEKINTSQSGTRLAVQLISSALNLASVSIPDSYGSISIDSAITQSGHFLVSNRSATINWITAKRNVSDIVRRIPLTSGGKPKVRSHLNMLYKPIEPIADEELVFAEVAVSFLNQSVEDKILVSMIGNHISRGDRPNTGRDLVHSLARCLFDKCVLYREDQWYIKTVSIRHVKMLQSVSMWFLDQIKRAHRNRMDAHDDALQWLLDFPLWRDIGIHRELNYDMQAIISVIQMTLHGLGMEKIKYIESEDTIVLIGGSI